jgi:predicted RNase H-like HicB family nuclease
MAGEKAQKKAKQDIHEALSLYIEDCIADGEQVPVSSAKVVDVDTLSIAVG